MQLGEFSHLGPFLLLSLLLIITPGPDTALVLRNSLAGGRRAGLATALGVGSGLATWTFAASLGVAALIAASGAAFLILKVVGAAYLIFLGAQALLAAVRGDRKGAPDSSPPRPAVRPAVALREGFLGNLANPKAAIFFTTFLPQFAPAGSPSFGSLLLLGLIFSTTTMVWLFGYATVAAGAREILWRPRVRRATEGVTGMVLVGFGLRLAAERR